MGFEGRCVLEEEPFRIPIVVELLVDARPHDEAAVVANQFGCSLRSTLLPLPGLRSGAVFRENFVELETLRLGEALMLLGPTSSFAFVLIVSSRPALGMSCGIGDQHRLSTCLFAS